MTPPRIYLSLGSNIGDRLANLRDAIAALPGAGVSVRKISSIYETEPVDLLEQPWFLNCALEAETSLEPQALLHALRAIDQQLGNPQGHPERGPLRRRALHPDRSPQEQDQLLGYR